MQLGDLQAAGECLCADFNNARDSLPQTAEVGY